MKEKNPVSSCSDDDKTAGALAASSIAEYFKRGGWKIISFFPNVSCVNRMQKPVRGKHGKKKGEASQNKPVHKAHKKP